MDKVHELQCNLSIQHIFLWLKQLTWCHVSSWCWVLLRKTIMTFEVYLRYSKVYILEFIMMLCLDGKKLYVQVDVLLFKSSCKDWNTQLMILLGHHLVHKLLPFTLNTIQKAKSFESSCTLVASICTDFKVASFNLIVINVIKS